MSFTKEVNLVIFVKTYETAITTNLYRNDKGYPCSILIN